MDHVTKITLIPSTKGMPMLKIDNYLYYKRQERRNGDIYWTCKHARKHACPAAVTTIGFTNNVRSMNIRHVGHGAETTVDLIIINKIATVKR